MVNVNINIQSLHILIKHILNSTQQNIYSRFFVSLILVLSIVTGFSNKVQGVSQGDIVTVAGNGIKEYSGDGGLAISATLNQPTTVAVDRSGNLYFADIFNNRVRKVAAATGIISTVAGNGIGNFSGDGGAAISANLRSPYGVAVDNSGNIYIADTNNNRIRKVDAKSGIITTVAGNGEMTFSGDGGQATSASLYMPTRVAIDNSGNIYISDDYNYRVRKVDVASNLITTVAGNGAFTAGGYVEGVAATSTGIAYVRGLAVDSVGNIYIGGSNFIRKVSAATGTITTLAGNGSAGFSGDGGVAASALVQADGISVDSAGNLYIADCGNHRIRKIGQDGIITTVAGNGISTFAGDGGSATSASLFNPTDVTVDTVGNLYIADMQNDRIRKVYFSLPTVNFNITPLRYSNQTTGTYSFSANEAVTFQCSLDGSAYTTCTSPFSYNSLTNGQHTASIKATDSTGNVSEPVSYTWTINTSLTSNSFIQLSQTGQAKCYDTTGGEITCTGTGQNGELKSGASEPTKRFNSELGDGIIGDRMTGLTWARDANLMATRDPAFDSDDVAGNGAVSWRRALDYVAKLNADNYNGFSDWRLPNISELASMISHVEGGNAAWLQYNGFGNVQLSYYWTSTSVPGRPSEAYDVYIDSGDVLTYLKTSTGGYVWPVRGTATTSAGPAATGQTLCFNVDGSVLSCSSPLAAGQDGAIKAGTPWPSPRFTDNGNSTFTDQLTGLSWPKNSRIMASRNPQFDTDGTPGDGNVTWQRALEYVQKLNQEQYLGYSDWRLPNSREFQSLTNRQQPDFSAWLDQQLGSSTQGSTWWSSTSVAVAPATACFYGVSDGVIGCGNSKTDAYSVWPVRGGISGITAQVSAIPANATKLVAVADDGNGMNYRSELPLTVGQTAAAIPIHLPFGSTYRVRVIATGGFEPTVLAGGKVASVAVISGQMVAAPVALLVPSVTIDPANPTTVAPGATVTLKWSVTDAANFLDDMQGRMRMFAYEGAVQPAQNMNGGQFDGVMLGKSGDTYNYSVTITAPGTMGSLFYKFFESSLNFDAPNGGETPFMILPDGNNSGGWFPITIAAPTTGARITVSNIPAGATEVIAVADGFGTPVRAAAAVTGSSVTLNMGIPVGSGYRLRVVAVMGYDTFPSILSGGKATGITVANGVLTPVAVALSPVSIALDPANPKVAYRNTITTLKWTVTDPANFLDEAVTMMRMFGVNNPGIGINMDGGPLANVLYGSGTGHSGDSYSYSITFRAPADATTMYYQFGESSPLFNNINSTQAPFLVKPDLVRSEQPYALPVISPLPQTGQTTCYDTAGAEIACDGTGQDGDIQAGMPWPNPRFTDNGDGTVTDNLTGLDWTKDANLIVTRDPSFDNDYIANDGQLSWQHALDYIEKLNRENYLNTNKWRLPNINELKSLTDLQATSPSLHTGNSFNNIKPDFYWSSTTAPPPSTGSSFWGSFAVNNRIGDISALSKYVNAYQCYLWPVKTNTSLKLNTVLIPKTGQSSCYNSFDMIPCDNSGQDADLNYGTAWPLIRFTENVDKTVIDNLTGLIWPKNAKTPTTSVCTSTVPKTWQGALDHVACLNNDNYLGFSDWRLPNRDEQLSLIDRQFNSPALTTNHPFDILNTYSYLSGHTFWTASNDATVQEAAWYVDMAYGQTSRDYRTSVHEVWPVRGGYIAPRLNITKSGTGTVTADTGTLAWDATNSNKATAYYEMGADTVVTLTAVPGTGLSTIWSGCDSFTGNTCTVTMSAKKNVTATFADTTAPSAPTNIEVQTPTIKGQLVITWTKPADADFSHVHVYRSTVSGVLGSLIGDNLTTLKFTDTGLASQTKYYYTVRAVDAAGNESTNTTQVSGTTLDATPPAYVTGGSATDATTGGKLNLSWTASAATDLAYYRIYRSDDGGITYTLAHNTVIGTVYADTGLTNGTRYYYSFTAVDTSGNESEQSTAHGLIWGKPTAPDTTPPAVISCTGTITQPLPLTGDKLQLNWLNPTDSDYALTRVYASTGSGLGTLVYSGTATSYLHTGLTAGTTYTYTYRSVDTAGNETTNTTSCSYTPVDQTAPTCPTELAAVRNLNNTVTLSWNRSASADIYSYQLFASAADAAVTYAAATTTVLSPTVTWTTGTLAEGKTYQFGIRTVDSLLTTPNVSGNCGVISVAIPNPAPACDVSTSIKVPQIGKKLGGNRTTVIAEVTSGSETNLASVRFQYRVSGIANSWLNIPSTDPVNFPNPDTVKPWFIHWDITGLADNTDYDIRAVATCANTALDTTPNYITVAVNRSNPDSDESDNGSGEQQKTETVGGEADSNVVKGDTDDTKVTKLTLPAQSLPEGTQVTVTESNPASKAALVPSDFDNGGVFREITFSDGRHILDNNKKAELVVPYKDDNNDGIVDGTTINIHDLQVCDYDSANSKWNCLDSTVDTTTKTVKAKTSSFSLFGLLAPPKPLSAGWNLVAVPLTPTPATATSVFGAGAFFYNPTTGAYPSAATVEPGKAYWVRNGFTAMKATGTETPDSSFSIPIQKGWNLIGNPFRYKVKVSDLQISNGSTVAMSVAETNGWTVGTLFNYSNGSYQMSTWQDGGTLDPWKGYWILSDINGTLIVPNTPAQ